MQFPMFFVGCGAVGRLPHIPFNHSLPIPEQLQGLVAGATGEIRVELKLHNEEITLCVSDTGRGTTSSSQSKTGTGLGLKLVEMLAAQIGGSFSIERNNGTTTTVKFAR